jgi:phage terminase large subunit GpA-like protein
MRQFAEEELILPTGPHEGRRFRIDRNPFAGLLFDAIDSGLWRRFAVTGPQQSGKTLQAFVLPILYHLFEMKETVIVGLPMMDMAADKWLEDIRPAIEQTRYRDLLPTGGAGSKGGKVIRIDFKNGATLRFMSGGGSDKKRAGFTSRVVVITETDGMDESGGTSREADKITQIEGRTRAYGDRARIYMECTVSTETGRTWKEYNGGTASRVAIRCPHCSAYVTPEREHLVGWQGAEDVLAAGDQTRVACPLCGAMWTEAERKAANAGCRLIHKGQTLNADGTVTGEPIRTNTLGFRWNAVNNLLVHQSVIGEGEWKASRDPDEDNADKAQRQFVWAIPSKAAAVDLTEFDAAAITRRTTTDMRGRVPSWCRRITVGIDIGKWLCHWTALAWGEHATPHVIEYGRMEVPSREMAEEMAITLALRKFRDEIHATGWPADGGPMKPSSCSWTSATGRTRCGTSWPSRVGRTGASRASAA